MKKLVTKNIIFIFDFNKSAFIIQKSSYIDEETIRAFQFSCELRQHIEKAIGYRFAENIELAKFYQFLKEKVPCDYFIL